MNIAEHIIAKCGGAPILAEIAGVDISRVYRWTYPKDRGGSAGLIPAKHHQPIINGAASRGIDISPSDFFTTAPKPKRGRR